ncbi:MAG: dihydroorotate dehydrogenase electron transfer subunit [Dehalococcoidia bacterium]
MEQTRCGVASNTEVMPGVHLMWIEAPNIARSAQPGQFVTVRCGDFPLRRPLSIHQCRFDQDSGKSEVAVLFRVTGGGTLWLAQRERGDIIDVIGPLGRGFVISPGKPGKSQHLLLVAGGMGIAPLVFLIQHLLEPPLTQASLPHSITLVHGASTASQLYSFDLARSGSSPRPDTAASLPLESVHGHESWQPLPQDVEFVPVTEDGSAGRRGMATDVLPEFLDRADHICACGPLGMYEAMADLLRRSGTPGNRNRLSGLNSCQVSLEVRMGCGFGACYGCTIRTRQGLKQVCRDGPVFEMDDIIWQEVRL